MFSRKRIEELVCCPRCKGALDFEGLTEYELGVQQGRLYCSTCERGYLIRDGIFYMQAPEVTAASKGWDLGSFDELYKAIGNEQSSYEWLAKLGVPMEIAKYEYQRVKGRMLDWLQLTDDGIVLDVGAGSGYFIFEMMGKCAERDISFVGIDPSVEHIKWLEYRKRKEKKSSVLTVVGDAQALPFRKETFDILVCSEVLEHIPSKQEAIAEMARVLKTGGILLLSTPSKKALDFWGLITAPLQLILAFRTRERSPAYDSPVYSRELMQYLKKAGFSIEDFELNVIMPPLTYFSHLPKSSGRIFTAVCGFLEKNLKKPLAPYFALSIVVRSKKTPDGKFSSLS